MQFITKYLSYFVLVLVLAVGGFIWVQTERIDSLKVTVDEQKQLIANQANELKSMKTDILGLQTLDTNRSVNRSELEALKAKVGKMSESDAKKDPQVAETQIKETVNNLLNDISGATK